ncbi:uncharacterized protein LOC143041451 [Oratosquilla oratoria]|uniref:uncharacterized protein LOC143041451 n=1 Tax=Oratosquilla oratoria TaxID=337810 RepID=UPI003F766CAC
MNVEEEDEFEEITTEEIVYALKKMKNNKSPGCDELAVEMLKQGGQEIKMYLKNIFNHAWNEGAIPDEWNSALICPIFKKGNKRKLLRAVKSIYKDCKSAVKCGKEEYKWFGIETGVRQGGVLSRLLFALYMDCILKNVNRVEDRVVTLAYADDVALASQNLEELQESLNRWNNALNEYGLRLNIEKCEVMTVSREESESVLRVGNDVLGEIEEFKYLGVNFNGMELMEREINTILRPILTYGAKTWKLTTKTESRIGAAEMRVLRIIYGVTRRDRMRNEVIRAELGVESVLEFLDIYRRMSDVYQRTSDV